MSEEGMESPMDQLRRAQRHIKERLEYLRGQILAERISYAEIAELQELAPYIEDDDTLLLEWAGVPEEDR